MKSEQFLIILVIGMTVITLGLIFLTQNTSNNANYPTKTFSKNNITFDYPET